MVVCMSVRSFHIPNIPQIPNNNTIKKKTKTVVAITYIHMHTATKRSLSTSNNRMYAANAKLKCQINHQPSEKNSLFVIVNQIL